MYSVTTTGQAQLTDNKDRVCRVFLWVVFVTTPMTKILWYSHQRQGHLLYPPSASDTDATEKGGYSTKFHMGRLCPEVQPLIFLYTVPFLTAEIPLSYTFY